MSPYLLLQNNIPVVRCTQFPGEFIINYPGKIQQPAAHALAYLWLCLLPSDHLQHTVLSFMGAVIDALPVCLQGRTTQASTTGSTVRSPQTLRPSRGCRSGCRRGTAIARRTAWPSR